MLYPRNIDVNHARRDASARIVALGTIVAASRPRNLI